MLKKDKYKIMLFLALLAIMVPTYSIVGKESIVMKSVAAGSLVVWLVGSRLIINKIK